MEQLQHDIKLIEEESGALGLSLNHHKSKIICSSPSTSNNLLLIMNNAKTVATIAATILGPSVGNICSVSNSISEKTQTLRLMGSRLQLLSAHDAHILLGHSLTISRLLHILRTSPCFASPALKAYDDEIQAILCAITNVCLEANSPAWTQASLLVKFGGLGVRSAVQLSSSAFLASFNTSL